MRGRIIKKRFLLISISLVAQSSFAYQSGESDATNIGVIKQQLQQQNIVTELKQDITLKSDRSTLNGITGIFEHCGNATLTQGDMKLTANCLIGKKNDDGTYAYIKASGSPASLIRVDKVKLENLEAKATNIDYLVAIKQFQLFGKADLKISQQKTAQREQGSIQVLANKITLEDAQVTNKEIHSTGLPLQIELVKSGKSELKAEAKKLYYNVGTSDLTLSEDVIANLALGQITAGVFEYNSKTKISSFKKSGNEQIEIVQTKKKSK